MWNAMQIDNPHIRELALTTYKANQRGYLEPWEEAFALIDIYELTGETFSALSTHQMWTNSINGGGY
jgi:hypothetical protein